MDALIDWIDHAPEDDPCGDQELASGTPCPGQRSPAKRRRLTHRASSSSLDDVLEIVASQGSDPPYGDGVNLGPGVAGLAL